MSLFTCSLNSGSNGNCYYVGNQEEGVLIDGGLSCREIVKRLKRNGLSAKKIKAIFVSHEHGDHVHGIPAFSNKYNVMVFITPDTLSYSQLEVREDLLRIIRPYEPVQINGMTITAFPKLHDACDPLGFFVRNESVGIGIFTDLGSACDHVIKHFTQCNAAFLEANYDERMLDQGSYPWPLKNRIKSDRGHMSNDQALDLFLTHRPSFMSHLFLSHLSADNNSPKLVKNIFSRSAGQTQIVIASRDRESRLFHIRSAPLRITTAPRKVLVAPSQLQLFR